MAAKTAFDEISGSDRRSSGNYWVKPLASKAPDPFFKVFTKVRSNVVFPPIPRQQEMSPS